MRSGGVHELELGQVEFDGPVEQGCQGCPEQGRGLDERDALVQLDTVHRNHLDTAAVRRVADHPPGGPRPHACRPLAFGVHLDVDGIEHCHRARCQGLEAAGAAVRILDRTAHTARLPFHVLDRR